MYNDRVITVNKEDLVKTLCKNRKIHKEEYLKALSGYKTQLEKKLKEQIKKLKNTEPQEEFELETLPFSPSHHLQDYDQYIQMLKWEIDKEVDITSTEFNNLINDEWNWTREFKQAYYSFSGIDIKRK